MSDDELDWQKNVKPIKCGKVTLKVDHKVNIKSMVDKGTSDLQRNFLNTNNGNSSFCLDKNTKSKVDRGKYFISDKLDLHGYNIEDAYCKLIDFIIKNYRAGNRCLLVITGYGSATNKTDTIKNNLNKWLNDTKIQHMVLYYQQATKKHGGKGAFYVLLRRLSPISCLSFLLSLNFSCITIQCSAARDAQLCEHCDLGLPGGMSPSTSFPVIPLRVSGISFHFMRVSSE